MNRMGPSFSFECSDFTMLTSRSDEISASASIYQARSSGPSGNSLMEARGSGLLHVSVSTSRCSAPIRSAGLSDEHKTPKGEALLSFAGRVLLHTHAFVADFGRDRERLARFLPCKAFARHADLRAWSRLVSCAVMRSRD
jgi:hypothetical protein